MSDPLDDLSRRGVSVWLDDLSRQRLATGSLANLVAHDHVVGVTTNPTIFAKAIAGGDDAYAGQLHDLWARGTSVEEALRALTTHDVRWACDVLRPVYDATDGVDGRASIEVDSRLAHDTQATIAEARASLEDHALDIFDASWRELGDQLAAALRRPREGRPREGRPREESGK